MEKKLGKPFVKGDPRINRKGRPRSFDQLRRLALSVLGEPAKGKDGQHLVVDDHIATNVELILRSAMKNPRFAAWLIEVAYGKVPDKLEVSGKSGGPIRITTDDLKSAESELAEWRQKQMQALSALSALQTRPISSTPTE